MHDTTTTSAAMVSEKGARRPCTNFSIDFLIGEAANDSEHRGPAEAETPPNGLGHPAFPRSPTSAAKASPVSPGTAHASFLPFYLSGVPGVYPWIQLGPPQTKDGELNALRRTFTFLVTPLVEDPHVRASWGSVCWNAGCNLPA